MKIPGAKAAVDKELGKLEHLPAWQMTKVRSKKKVIKEAQKEGKTVHCATLVDMPRQELGVGTEIPKVLRTCCTPGVTLRQTILALTLYLQGSSASRMTAAIGMECHSKATRMLRTGSGRSMRLQASQTGGRSSTAETSQVRVSGHLDTSTTT